MHRVSIVFCFVFILFLCIITIPLINHAFETIEIENEIINRITNYYDLYSNNDMVEADDIVDQRLKNVNEIGTIQQFLVKDAVIYGAYRLEHYFKYLSDHYYIHTPYQFHIQTTDDVVIAAFLLKQEKKSKADDSLLESKHYRVTWVFKQKYGEWVVFHEHQSNFEPGS